MRSGQAPGRETGARSARREGERGGARPAATAGLEPLPPDEREVALKRIPICETNRETVQGAMAMMRARNAREFDAALAAMSGLEQDYVDQSLASAWQSALQK